MYFDDFCKATTTTSGTGNATLAAVTNYFLPSSMVPVGDQAVLAFKDANGGKEVSLCTLVSTSPDLWSRDTCYRSSNSGSKISLSGGSTEVAVVACATDLNKRMAFADAFIDCVLSGLLLPSTSGTLAGTMSPGVAYVMGQRVVKGAQAHTYTASRDNYVDISNLGVLTYPTPVTIGAGAPALTANSTRLGFVTTGSSTIVSAKTSGWDSLGNPIRNLIMFPACTLLAPYNVGIFCATNTDTPVTFGSGTEEINNDGMHSTTTNNSRVTANHAGLYSVTGLVQFANGSVGLNTNAIVDAQVAKNGTVIEGTQASTDALSGEFPAVPTQWSGYLATNDFLELQGRQASVGSGPQTIVRGRFHVIRAG